VSTECRFARALASRTLPCIRRFEAGESGGTEATTAFDIRRRHAWHGSPSRALNGRVILGVGAR
jgi:hypothetical protein